MSALDIVTLVIFAAAIVVCVWKGFLKILLKLGALVTAVIIARIFGASVGELWFSDLVKTSSETIDASVFENINESLATVIGTVVVFWIFYIVLRIIFLTVAKLVKKAPSISVADRILGAVLGVVVAFGITFVFAELMRVVATTVTYFDPDSAIFALIEDSNVFKYFF